MALKASKAPLMHTWLFTNEPSVPEIFTSLNKATQRTSSQFRRRKVRFLLMVRRDEELLAEIVGVDLKERKKNQL